MTTPRSQMHRTHVGEFLRNSRIPSFGTTRLRGASFGETRLRGFTLVELLVVITIIGMLMALLIPAVGAVRDRARQTQCSNNIKQIGVAVMNFNSSKDRFPGYVEPVQQAGGSFAHIAFPPPRSMANAVFVSEPARQGSQISWAAHLLPHVERQDLWDNLTTVNIDASSTDPRRSVVPLDVYLCPADTELVALPDNAGLSYVANTGAWDWEGTNFLGGAGKGDTVDNGLFHDRVRTNLTTRLGSNIRDGSNMTLMLAENIHKNQQYCWMGVGPLQRAEQYFGMVWVANIAPKGDTTDLTNQAPLGTEPVAPDGSYIVNVLDAGSETIPFYARPASNHPGGAINVVFADGHTDTLSPDIEYTVYQRIMTPNGRDCEDPRGHLDPVPTPPGEHAVIQQFRQLPPISESDF